MLETIGWLGLYAPLDISFKRDFLIPSKRLASVLSSKEEEPTFVDVRDLTDFFKNRRISEADSVAIVVCRLGF